MCLDVKVDANKVRVSQMSEHGQYKSVQFGTDYELEYFLKKHIKVELEKCV